MINGRIRTRWTVRLSIARRDGWRSWLVVSGDFECGLEGLADGRPRFLPAGLLSCRYSALRRERESSRLASAAKRSGGHTSS